MSFNLLHTRSLPIYEQLLLEEALLRTDDQNWCLINEGSSPAIVMGISGKKEELIDLEKASLRNIPIIKRFSGGGTVVVDEETLFITFICNKAIHPFPAYPEPIAKWTEQILSPAFNHPEFALRENDFVIGSRKCGGNAQYIKKERWLHHISFLWNYTPHNMELLLHPKKTPPYRQGRSHQDFICRLSDHFSSKEALLNQLKDTLQEQLTVKELDLEQVQSLSGSSFRQSTELMISNQ